MVSMPRTSVVPDAIKRAGEGMFRSTHQAQMFGTPSIEEAISKAAPAANPRSTENHRAMPFAHDFR